MIKFKNLIIERTDKTIHSKGEVVATNYKLKKDTKGWWKSNGFADEDSRITLKKGTVIDGVIKHSNESYSMYSELTGKQIGSTLFSSQSTRWESDELKFKNN